MPLSNRIWSRFETGDHRDFLVSPNLKLSYDDVAHGIRCWMALFDVAGLAEGDRFVLRTQKDSVAILAFLAGLVDGIVPVLLEGSCPDARLTSIVAAVEPKLVASDRALPELPAGIFTRNLSAQSLPSGRSRFFGGRKNHFQGVSEPAAKRDPRRPDDEGLAYLLFTSGTTSEPSGVEITRSNLSANLATLSRLAACSTDSRIFNDMILAHADGMIQGPVIAAWNGGAVLRADGFELHRLEEWLGHIRQMRATHFVTVPTVWSMIDRYAAYDDYFDAPECRVLMTVAAKMPDDLWKRIETRFALPLFSHYGLTETVASSLYAGDHPEMGSTGTIGRPVDCEARIAEGAGEGELQLRGDNVFRGYWRNPQRTQDSFTQDGWFRTGDLARQRDDGSYDILGRLKTVIMTGGFLIRPDEVDEAMLRHPAVIDSVTLGVPDDVFGEIGVTGVVLSGSIEEAALAEHLSHHLEPRKIPKHIIALDQIPRGLSGKATLDALRKLLIDAVTSDNGRQVGDDVSTSVLQIAARLFRVPLESLSLRTTPKDVSNWDSFSQLNLILLIEDHFQCQFPAAKVLAIRKLGDFATLVSDCK